MIEILQTFMNTMTSSSADSSSSPTSTSAKASPSTSDTEKSSTNTNWIMPRSSLLWPILKSKPDTQDEESKEEILSQTDKYESLPQYTLAQVSEHWQPNDCWIVVEDLVYDVTEFLDEHPGGQYIVMEHAGRDATMVFRGSCHSQDAYDMLEKYLVGILIESERLYWSRSSSRSWSTSSTFSQNSKTSSNNSIKNPSDLSILSSSPKPSIGL